MCVCVCVYIYIYICIYIYESKRTLVLFGAYAFGKERVYLSGERLIPTVRVYPSSRLGCTCALRAPRHSPALLNSSIPYYRTRPLP